LLHELLFLGGLFLGGKVKTNDNRPIQNQLIFRKNASQQKYANYYFQILNLCFKNYTLYSIKLFLVFFKYNVLSFYRIFQRLDLTIHKHLSHSAIKLELFR
ncbi:MAG: hypothetical protein WCJ33_09955, partial [Pseudomonadota bacterium]